MGGLMQSVPDDPDTAVIIESTANGVGGDFHADGRRPVAFAGAGGDGGFGGRAADLGSRRIRGVAGRKAWRRRTFALVVAEIGEGASASIVVMLPTNGLVSAIFLAS
jgi:hypothetical protein